MEVLEQLGDVSLRSGSGSTFRGGAINVEAGSGLGTGGAVKVTGGESEIRSW